MVLGNEVSGDRSWQGLIKFVAIHDRALTAPQVLQNYNAGVGQRFYLLFNVADVTGVSKGYILLTASQYEMCIRDSINASSFRYACEFC